MNRSAISPYFQRNGNLASFGCWGCDMVRVTKLATSSGLEVELGPLSGDLLFLARNLHILLRGESFSIRQNMGMEAGVIAILSVVWLNPGISQNELASAIVLRKAAVTKLVKKMEADGLLSRRRTSHDRRTNSLMLTEKGQQTIAKIRPMTATLQHQLFEPIDAEEKEVFFDVLTNLVAQLSGRVAAFPEDDEED
ncbi:MarR family winged helix-turn-helix transcriptional regulator [Paracoccus albus]|uniref:MarR family winged helix-turn-helix transcriptional regulator n=1 Tax=Paracoccus albus TaxID=3017784 RepID=UPI0022F01654|nr:MarR family winged helix-turn-helix transcriptional regulator [Paracoccus albus]WBU61240.1 MarR family winged helix-turn-helix transcriptional regulator [Paracoccus albus]